MKYVKGSHEICIVNVMISSMIKCFSYYNKRVMLAEEMRQRSFRCIHYTLNVWELLKLK